MDKLYSGIYKDLKDLPQAKKLTTVIYNYVKKHKYYNLAIIGSIIDDFYKYSCGLAIAEDIKILFN